LKTPALGSKPKVWQHWSGVGNLSRTTDRFKPDIIFRVGLHVVLRET